MCNLYKTKNSADEIAALFDAVIAEGARGANVAEEIFPGMPGFVVRNGDNGRLVQSMVWGFPLVTREMRARAEKAGKAARPKPVNNARELGSPFWKSAAANPARRCLIPVECFAEAEGPKGGKTRTWFSLPDEPLFAWAGLWRPSPEWGDVYAGVMTEANDLVAPVHDRMPVILAPQDQDRWMNGSFEEILALQRPADPHRMEVLRTEQPWTARR